MLRITKQVATQFAVYDTDDGSLEWTTRDQIEACIRNGMQFTEGAIKVEPNMCNFGKGGVNIFQDAHRISNSEFAGGGKKFRYKINGELVYLNNGICIDTIAFKQLVK